MYYQIMNRDTTPIICLTLSLVALSLLQGCNATANRSNSLKLVPGQDVIVNYALDVETRRYSKGKFVSMDANWITIEKESSGKTFGQRDQHASFRLDRVYLIQSAQE